MHTKLNISPENRDTFCGGIFTWKSRDSHSTAASYGSFSIWVHVITTGPPWSCTHRPGFLPSAPSPRAWCQPHFPCRGLQGVQSRLPGVPPQLAAPFFPFRPQLVGILSSRRSELAGKMGKAVFQSAQGFLTKYLRWSGLINRDLFPCSSGGWKSTSRCWKGWFLLGPLSVSCRWPPSHGAWTSLVSHPRLLMTPAVLD